MTSIRWEQLEPAAVERVITALLVRTVDGAKPVEGAGGDEGADVVAPMLDGEHVYEIKSFTGRLTRSHRQQILASLRTARDRRPTMRAWTLVLPTDLTPGEQRWFDTDLRAEVGVPLDWIGRIALDAAFAERPDLSRNFLPGSAERLALNMLIQEGRESAALAGGFPDAVTRGVALRALASKVDPDWDVDLDIAADGATVHLRPKDPGAFERSMIGGSLQLRAEPGTAEAQAVHDFELFGAPLHLDGEHIAHVDLHLPGQLDTLLENQGNVTSLAIDTPPGTPQRMQLVSLRAGRIVRRLPMTLTHTTQGMAGGRRLVLVDDSGVLRLEFRIQPEQTPITPGEVGFEVAMRPDRHPHDVLPAIQFLAGLADSDGLRLDIPGAPAAPIRLPQATAPTVLAPIRTFLAQLQALQRVQDATGTTFGVPTLTRVDQDMLYFADQLLAHGYVEWYWPGMSVRLPLDQVERVLSSGPLIPRMNLDGSGGGPIAIAGHTVTMPGTITLHVSNAVVVNPAELRRIISQPTPPPNALVHLGVQDDTQVIFRLQAEATESGDDPAPISEAATS